jgi:hypothetical protein
MSWHAELVGLPADNQEDALMWLLVISAIGFVVPNGVFLYWLFNEYPGFAVIGSNHLAVAFIVDVFIAMLLLAYWYAKHPIGRVRWPWFIVLSLAGGLAFSLPLFWWLNEKKGFAVD